MSDLAPTAMRRAWIVVGNSFGLRAASYENRSVPIFVGAGADRDGVLDDLDVPDTLHGHVLGTLWLSFQYSSVFVSLDGRLVFDVFQPDIELLDKFLEAVALGG